ncbi:RNA dependent RNA polymerase-domain-containing protein [Cercophora newfieldiana]|uniref:RNA-dependent RNA polymerase n=1 Tax=Cercophora newfieldiana TaxID=92897 RepID=A0AA39YPR9_9PEZI|nr:RNA dependent RNA polymerase-domain-containing protein [Cercophora newfieldiana]
MELPDFVKNLPSPPRPQRSLVPTAPRSRAPRRQNWPSRHGQNGIRFSNGRNDAPPPAPIPGFPVSATIPAEWRSRRSAMMILRGIQRGTTAWQIYTSLNAYGNIVYIDVDDRGPVGMARVRFEPPPHSVKFFDQGRCKIMAEFVHWAWIEFPRQAEEDREIRTPIGNLCSEMAVLDLSSVSFGVLVEPTVFMNKATASATRANTAVKLIVDFKKRRFLVRFPAASPYSGSQAQPRDYKVDIKFDNIRKLYRVDNGARSALVVVLNNPPVAWRMRANVSGTFGNRPLWGENELWMRCTEVSRVLDTELGPLSLQDDHQIINFGRWTTYWFEIDAKSTELLTATGINLRDWNLELLNRPLTQTADRKPELWRLLDRANACHAASSTDDLMSLDSSAPPPLPFDVRYQLEVCISHDVLSEYNIDQRFIDRLSELAQIKVMEFNRARLVLEYAADQGKRIFDPMTLLENENALRYIPTTARLPEHCALLRKATITPTKIYFNTPTVETTNRVIREYKPLQENFLRIQFTDDVGKINGCEDDRDDEIYVRAFRVLTKGITMGDVEWKFLACGNSQIRESGAYFFHDQGAVTGESIRKWMGRFSHITVVAKYAARLGQCFSTTRPIPKTSAPKIVKIQDVEKGKYCFTDGVGKMSSLLAGMVANDWNISSPSAIQFRMGGCKGVLVVWPEIPGVEVHIRKSQEKFLAEYNGLEIIRCSQYACATLNRQTISILSCLGVPAQVFVEMMKEQLASYDAAMKDAAKASDLLSRFVDENQMTNVIEEMVLNGFMDSQEPFVHTLLHLWRSWSIKALKEKAKLIVDKGAFVLGGVDETDTLRGYSAAVEGRKQVDVGLLPEIFLQVPDPGCDNRYKVIEGLCLVGRNPSLHPGDIRVVRAVDSPKLRHIRDVVIFPRNGDRDIPSMCSGGDLDGDDFFVIWDERLLPKEWSHSPMDYAPPAPLEEPNGVSADALKHFFVLYMKNNNLPLIAHAHLAKADCSDGGAKHQDCLQLANLHSQAVDYVKTGVPANWSRRFEPRKWPHYMEKSRKGSYHSTTALGQLYDMVQREVFDVKEGYKLPFDDRILKRYKLPNEVLKKARRLKTQYDIAMRRVMAQLEINTEFELWTGFVMSKPRVGSSYKVQEKVGQESYALKKTFRDLCIKESGAVNGPRDIENFGPFVAAMYRVTWEEVRIALNEAHQPHFRANGNVGKRRISARSMPLISFPWLFHDVLGEIAGGEAAKQKAARLMHLSIPNREKKMSPAVNEMKTDEMDLDTYEEAMTYTRIGEGQFIHRGEILHLFHHDDDDEEDQYWGSEEAAQPQPLPQENVSNPDGPAPDASLIDLVESEPVNNVTDSNTTAPSAGGGYLDDLAQLRLEDGGSDSENLEDKGSDSCGYEAGVSDTETSSGGSSAETPESAPDGAELEEGDGDGEVVIIEEEETAWERLLKAAAPEQEATNEGM